jgi:hypothetical protein
MHTIELILKSTPMPLSVQRKTEEEAQALYQQLLEAMKSSSSQIIEMTCDRQPGKKVAIMTGEIAAIMMTEKAGTAATGKPAGFFVMSE